MIVLPELFVATHGLGDCYIYRLATVFESMSHMSSTATDCPVLSMPCQCVSENYDMSIVTPVIHRIDGHDSVSIITLDILPWTSYPGHLTLDIHKSSLNWGLWLGFIVTLDIQRSSMYG